MQPALNVHNSKELEPENTAPSARTLISNAINDVVTLPIVTALFVCLVMQKDTKGQVLFDQVCRQLNLIERHCFGLRFVDANQQRVSCLYCAYVLRYLRWWSGVVVVRWSRSTKSTYVGPG